LVIVIVTWPAGADSVVLSKRVAPVGSALSASAVGLPPPAGAWAPPLGAAGGSAAGA
jgi:hypothetical protein